MSRVSCPSNLEDPMSGVVEIQGDGTLGSMAVYSCELGYEVAGEPVRECQLNGLIGIWSGIEPTCEGQSTQAEWVAHLALAVSMLSINVHVASLSL